MEHRHVKYLNVPPKWIGFYFIPWDFCQRNSCRSHSETVLFFRKKANIAISEKDQRSYPMRFSLRLSRSESKGYLFFIRFSSRDKC